MVFHFKYSAERLRAIRAVVAVSAVLTSNPSAAEYCVICTDPVATYRCFLPQANTSAVGKFPHGRCESCSVFVRFCVPRQLWVEHRGDEKFDSVPNFLKAQMRTLRNRV